MEAGWCTGVEQCRNAATSENFLMHKPQCEEENPEGHIPEMGLSS